MELLTSLGINSTIFIQLPIILITFALLNKIALGPYVASYKVRSSRAVTNEDLARQLFVETQDLEFHYERRARQINDDVKVLFDTARSQGQKEQTQILDSARAEAGKLVEATRAEIQRKVESARRDLEREIPALSQAISSKLVGKEVAL